MKSFSRKGNLMQELVVGILSLLALSSIKAADELAYIWVEAERPAEANFEFTTEATGRSTLLSNGKWMRRSLNKEEAARSTPAGGFLLRYNLNVLEAGDYHVWARVGFEWARPPIEWRIGDAPWTKIEPEESTTNVMELAEWMEVAWLHLGDAVLKRGRTTMAIRYREPGRDGRMLIALDCIALTKGKFFPEGPFKPGESYDSEADKQASANCFQMPPPTDTGRTQIKLNGLWQVARYDDPDMDKETYLPVQKIPSPDEYPLRWMGIEVPMSLWNKTETIFAHRVIYRTRVNVPAEHAGRGFKLHFSGTNWIVSVLVNGALAGTHRGVWIPWDLDISNLVKPGEVNEIAVAVKGPYYSVDAPNYRGTIQKSRNRPRSRQRWVRWVAPIYPSTKGDGDGLDYGIVNPVTLVSVGNAYTEDVFVRPSVAKKRLDAEITVRNTTDKERQLSVLCEAAYDKNDKVEKSFGPADITVPANDAAQVTVSGEWSNPKLWWPKPAPDLYRLRTTISEDGKPIDIQEELFGFREVTIKGPGIYINGVRRNVWCWVDVHGRPQTGEELLKEFRQEKNRFMRFSKNRKTSAFLPSREERLEFYDRNGIAGRLCSMIDGMFVSFALVNRQKDPRTGKRIAIPNEPIWEGFRRHVAQLTRAYRNHPSVIFYQVENELVYINGMNLYGGHLDMIEEEMNKVVEAGRKNDPTRPYTVGGAGDLSGKLEINSPHYPAGSLDFYPENAYTLEKYAPKITRWPWTRKKPWVVGESAHANQLRYGSYVRGDDAFRGPDYQARGKAKYLRMLYGGYRYAGVAGFFPWDNLYQYDDAQKTFSDLCIIPRKQTHRLVGGKEGKLLFKVMNDTLSGEPVTFEWSYEADGKQLAGEKATLKIEPGFGQEQTLSITPPKTDRRIEGELTVKATHPEADDFVDVRSVPILPEITSVKATATVTVLDRSGKLESFLKEVGVTFEKVEKLADSNGKTGLLVIGPDTLTPEEAFGQDILSFAGRGGKVIVLEQDVPAAGTNLPSPLRTTTHYGGYAHPQAVGTPIFKDLGKDDLIDWAGDHPTYKNCYLKPTQGGRSLVECGGLLKYTALVEMACGDGVIVLCQLRVGAKLRRDAAADVLLRNLIEYYSDYEPASGVAAIYSPEDPLLADKVRETGALAEIAKSLGEALDPKKYKAAVIHASQENLTELIRLKQKALAFQNAGGWIMFNGLSPDGIEAFNELMDAKHLIRPFRVERVTLEQRDFSLAATLGNREVALFSNKVIAAWKGLNWVSGNTYSYVIDGRDIAPFCKMPGGSDDPYVYKPTFDDKDPHNFVNGMFNSDFWRYIRQIWIPETGAEPLTFKLRRPETISEIRIWNNANYWTIKDMDIIFDSDEKNAIRTELADSYDMTEVEFPPRKVEKTITLQTRSWRERATRPGLRLVGIDNVQFLRAQSPRGAVFIDNVGGLVAFPRGKGGVMLNQIKFMEDEPNKENASKKLTLTSVILQNMGIGSRAAKVAIPGVNIRYEPIVLTDYCNQYLSETAGKPGWFGQRGRDLRNFKVGEQVLANVAYHPVDYATAPVPNCIMLGARGAPAGLPKEVTGIKVGKKADLLFFLHAARVTRPISDRERSRIGDQRRQFLLPEVARYVIHYTDGKTAAIPVILEKHVDHWEQEKPRPLEGAAIAWSGPIPRVENKKAVLYSVQAANPRPDVPIESIDIQLGKDAQGRIVNRAAPVVLAITVGNILAEGSTQ